MAKLIQGFYAKNVRTGKEEHFEGGVNKKLAVKFGVEVMTLKQRIIAGPGRTFNGYRFRTAIHPPFPEEPTEVPNCKVSVTTSSGDSRTYDSIHEVAGLLFREVNDLILLFGDSDKAKLGNVKMQLIF